MKIGIIGGGQLAWMICLEAKKLGHETIVLDPNPLCSASFICDKLIISNYNDLNNLELLCKSSDVVTYEFENIPSEVLLPLEKKYNIYQGYKPLYLSQNRIREKDSFKKLNFKLPKYERITNYQELLEKIKIIKYPCILKTTTLGYDGKGHYVINNESDIPNIDLFKNNEYILEEKINFDYEVSLICIKNKLNEFIYFPIPKNIHRNQILHLSIVGYDNHNIPNEFINKIKDYFNYYNLYGIITFELFKKGNYYYINEIAPRPHNSGHYSLDLCDYNQYSELVNCITNNKLNHPNLLSKGIMANILGQHYKNLEEIKNCKLNHKLYLYNKDEVRLNRKMGHITFINEDLKIVLEFVERYLY